MPSAISLPEKRAVRYAFSSLFSSAVRPPDKSPVTYPISTLDAREMPLEKSEAGTLSFT